MMTHKNNSHHKGLYNDSNTRLDHHDNNRQRTPLRRIPCTIANRLLRFNREQYGTDKVLNALDTSNVIGRSIRVQVTIPQGDQVPGGGKAEPADYEAEGEHEHIVAPLEVDEGGEYVGQVTTSPLVYVAPGYVDVAVLEEETTLLVLLD